ncbi:antitoxin Xre/MbcA/ParS toxin-binding domain-containing protein [Pseudomonas sp. OV226]|uniref:antitoxin Xre/MbcA/ParS toxin-binding domain-containing protein n=1 Tax=Pseudomonas sp. OV226 TaxID=2135588 RepID=UPI000D6D056C|nr:antitoxin Xre/MbcA/ParS toxin-binding domain-containing protein [Pseudomonas sp. OV226]
MFPEFLRENAHRSYRIRLQQLLGIPCCASDQDIHELIEYGFTPFMVISLCDLGVIAPLAHDQIVPLKTLRLRAARKQRLSVHESDRLFQHIHITAMAEVIFGDETKARRWLSKPICRFAGRRPYEMLSTSQGIREVEIVLIQLAEAYAF